MNAENQDQDQDHSMPHENNHAPPAMPPTTPPDSETPQPGPATVRPSQQSATPPLPSLSPVIADFENADMPKPAPVANAKYTVYVLLTFGVLALLVAFGVAANMYVKNTSIKDPIKDPPAVKEAPQNKSLVSTLPVNDFNALSGELKAALQAMPLDVYYPNSMAINNGFVYISRTNPSNSTYTYSNTSRFGYGLFKGMYSFTAIKYSEKYNPPSSCVFYGSDNWIKQAPCVYYEFSDKDLPAYTYAKYLPGSIQNVDGGGKIAEPLSIIAKRGNVVVRISSVDTTATELYALLKSMEKIKPLQLPEKLDVMFLD